MADEFELDETTYKSVKILCAEGDASASAQRFEDAVAMYNKAWNMIPDPKNNWEASTWILAAIADACFQAGYMTSAREALEYAMTCPKGIGNPFLHLRYGQILYEAGELDKAADEFMRSYMGGGSEIFSTEDAKYLAFLSTRTNLFPP